MIGNATLQVRAGFGEADAARIAVGQPATITVSALPDTTLSAHVVQVDQTSTVVSNVVTYYVTLQLDRKVTGLKPGMTVTAQVIADKRDGALHVPSAAVTGTGASARVTVVAADGTQTTETVVVGLVGDESTEIVSGLSLGQTVVTATATAATTGTGQTGVGRLGGVGFPGGGLPGWRAARWLTPRRRGRARRRSCCVTSASHMRWAPTSFTPSVV
jgi:multidrug efflux pump subunit AcrA (membrane-fusion protein)